MLRVAAQSVQYVVVPVLPTGTTEQDPTAEPVYVAALPEGGSPAVGDWKTAAWDATAWPPEARVLVGPGTDLALSPGEYVVWIKFGVGMETPVLPAGPLEVF